MLVENIIAKAVRIAGSTPLGSFSAYIEGIAEFLENAEKRNRVLRILWFFCTVLMIFVTACASLFLWWLISWKAAAFAGVVLWAIYLGAPGLLFLPSKAMTAIFGAFAGISLSEISSGAGLIAAINRFITELSVQIGAVVVPDGDADPFINVLVWTFVLVTLLISLPAFFAQEKASVALQNVGADPGTRGGSA